MPSTFVLRVLGLPEVVDTDGDPVDLPLGKPLAALCYVALEGSRVTREDLGAVLWSRSSPDRARASVRQALWLLRKTIGEDLLTEDERGLRLDRSRVDVDLERLEAHLAGGGLVEAWKMWEGGPLHAFSIPDAPRWNTWADRVRGTWERRFGEALEIQAAAEDGEARVTWLRRALEVRPYREGTHAALVETFIHQHRVEEAEAALHEARTVVDDPTPGLLPELEERLRAIRKQPFDTENDRLHFEFVGRAAEFSALSSLWRSVLSGRTRVAVILGPSGIGKSRLSEEFLDLAATDGARIVTVKGIDGERAIELGGLALMTRELLTLPGAAGISAGSQKALQALVPSIARTADGSSGIPGRAALGDALLDLVEAVSHEGPLVLRLEDLQWIDSASRELLLRTLRHLREVPVLLVSTCRSEDADAAILRRLGRLREEGQAAQIHLEPLSRTEVGEMLGLTFHFADERLADAATERLYRASGGNPLFLLELLHGLRERDLIRRVARDESAWELVDLPSRELALPGTLREALRRRLTELSESGRILGAALASTDGGLTPAQLIRRAGLAESDGTEAVAELLRRDVVRWDRDDRLQVAHDSMREFLRGGRGPRRRQDRRRLVAALAAVGAAGAVIAALLAVRGEGGPGTMGERPFGGGTLFIERRGLMTGHDLRLGPEGEIELVASDSIRAPSGVVFTGPPSLDTAGRWVVPATGKPAPDEAPDAWLVRRDTAWRVYGTDGDDNLREIAPDGRHYLLTVQDPDTSTFRMNLVRYDPETDSATIVARGSGDMTWSSDGSMLLGQVDADRDTLVILRPDGRRLAARAMDEGGLGSRRWCGPEAVIGLHLPPARGPEVLMWWPFEQRLDPLQLPVPISRAPACSPDGSALAYLGRADEGEVLVVWHRPSDDIHTFQSPGGVQTLHWVGHAVRGAPRRVDLRPDSVALVRGERLDVEPDIEGVPDPLPEHRLDWSSSDSLVASVTREGTVIGNGPGAARVRLTVDGWLSDSVVVTVSELEGRGGPVFTDVFDGFDRTSWYPVGVPVPMPDTVDGQAVLSMNGDGRYRDGVVSRERFAVDRGVRLEVDFHLVLTDVDRQSVDLCLLDGDPGEDPGVWEDWVVRESLCFRWPAYELADRDEGEALFTARTAPMGPIRIDDEIRMDEWNRPSVRLRPDGTAELFLNENHVATLVDPIPLRPGERWRLAVFGRAWGTELFARNLVLW